MKLPFFLFVLYLLYFVPLAFALGIATTEMITAGYIVLAVTVSHNIAGLVVLLGTPGPRWDTIRRRYKTVAPWIADTLIEVALALAIYTIVANNEDSALAAAIVATIGNIFCMYDNFRKFGDLAP